MDQLVYKAREPGENGYDLPSKYATHADQRDYYHVGWVESVNPLCIVHCTSVDGGIKRDNTLGKWEYAGECSLVEYNYEVETETEEIAMAEYQVVNGNLNMRNGPGRAYGVIATIPDGSIVDVIADEWQDWMKVQYKQLTGYCMSEFLRKIGENGSTDEIDAAFREVEDALQRLRELIQK